MSRLGRALKFALAASLALAGAAVRADTPKSTVEAAYLFRFTPFVDWPASAFASPSSPFRLCVLGDDPFGQVLDEAVSGRSVDAHPIEVRRIKTASAAPGCHMLFFSGSRATGGDLFGRIRGNPTLTVTDESDGVSGEIIEFVVRDGHVRFAIDATAAAANGVKISSKLLSLATPMRPGS
jgi:hypothetical protein